MVCCLLISTSQGAMDCRFAVGCESVLMRFLWVAARDKVEESLEGFSFGADDYITKPFDLRLLHRVHRSRFSPLSDNWKNQAVKERV